MPDAPEPPGRGDAAGRDAADPQGAAPPAPDAAAEATVSPFADHRHLIIIVIGLIVGLVLGPAVLGRVAPSAYQTLLGGMELQRELRAFPAETARRVETLEATGVTPDAVTELMAQRELQERALAAQLAAARDRRITTITGALVLALLIVVVVESLLGPDPAARRASVSPMLGRLVTVRYALLAAWIAAALVRPRVLAGDTMVLAVLLVAVALGAGLVPLGRNAEADA